MNLDELLKQWHAGIRIAHVGHRFAATHYESLNRTVGVSGAVASALVGTTLFSTLGTLTNSTLQIALGLISILAATLAALHTFFNYSELAEKHKLAASRYANLRREYEQLLTSSPEKDNLLEEYLGAIREKWSLLDQESPTIPKNVYKKAQDAIKQEDERRLANKRTDEKSG